MDKPNNIDHLFKIAREQKPVASFNETKGQFLNALSGKINSLDNTKRVHFFTTKKGIMIISTLSTIAISFLIISNLHLSNKELNNKNKTVLPKEKTVFKQQKAPTQMVEKQSEQMFITPCENTVYDSHEDESMTLRNLIDVNYPNENYTPKITPPLKPQLIKNEEDGYVFPKLTEDEIKANQKQKKSMLKNLSKFNNDVYTYVPSGTFDYNGKQTSVQGFYMGKTEVSNLEYRTFLFDLLIQGRKDEFLKAKPDQSQWLKLKWGEDNKMKDMYFSHEAFNNYPVVNISREGAEMYTKWLTAEMIKYVGTKNEKKYNDVRIPSKTEWIYAASNLGSKYLYPWNTDKIVNPSNCFLANFLLKGYTGSLDSIACKNIDKNQVTTAGAVQGISEYTTKVNNYNPSNLGLYCLSGNVSEMIYNSNGNRVNPGTAGGSWMDSEEDLKIYAKDKNEGIIEGRPNIGFRVVITYTLIK
ncbi:MAG: SUMF1/EgtB/PvdO family nonheme iron enzyme [Flavobacteriia bacterium]|nr:SUMF1/EgtB/PvdO family nonheme iron enzyme [Flavobacteriia bacterium]